MVSSTPRPHFTPGKDPVPILQDAWWAPGPVWTGGKFVPTGIRSPTVQPVVSRYTDRATWSTHTHTHTHIYIYTHSEAKMKVKVKFSPATSRMHILVIQGITALNLGTRWPQVVKFMPRYPLIRRLGKLHGWCGRFPFSPPRRIRIPDHAALSLITTSTELSLLRDY